MARVVFVLAVAAAFAAGAEARSIILHSPAPPPPAADKPEDPFASPPEVFTPAPEPLFVLDDGSRFRGSLDAKEIEFETEFGVLRIPRDKAVRIALGARPDPALDRRIEDLAGKLHSPEPSAREQAATDLLQIGPRAIPAVRQALDNPKPPEKTGKESKAAGKPAAKEASKEASAADRRRLGGFFAGDRARPMPAGKPLPGPAAPTGGGLPADPVKESIRDLLSTLEGVPGGAPPSHDRILTTRFAAAGRARLDVLEIKTAYGPLRIPREQVREIDFCASGNARTFSLSPRPDRESSIVNTGVFVRSGDRIRVRATGNVMLHNWGALSSPNGLPQYGLWQAGIPNGALAARIGSDGAFFLAGADYEEDASESGVLYFGIGTSARHPMDSGEYRIALEIFPRGAAPAKEGPKGGSPGKPPPDGGEEPEPEIILPLVED